MTKPQRLNSRMPVAMIYCRGTGPIPGLRVDGVTFCGKEMILDMEDAIYRGDTYRLSVCAWP